MPLVGNELMAGPMYKLISLIISVVNYAEVSTVISVFRYMMPLIKIVHTIMPNFINI